MEEDRGFGQRKLDEKHRFTPHDYDIMEMTIARGGRRQADRYSIEYIWNYECCQGEKRQGYVLVNTQLQQDGSQKGIISAYNYPRP